MTLIQKQTKKIFKGAVFLFGLLVLFVTNMFSEQGGGSLSKLSQKASDILGGTSAHADTPPPPSGGGKSLVVEYWNGTAFEGIDVYSPRYYQPALNAIKIPARAIQTSGEINIRVTSTKRHQVYFTGLVAPKKNFSLRTERFSVKKAFHKREEKDYADVLNKECSGEYLRTIPGDTVDIAFKVGAPDISSEERNTYVLKAGGVYTKAGETTQREAGDWVSKLDPEALSFLRKMYALNTYHDKDRVPVLSKNA